MDKTRISLIAAAIAAGIALVVLAANAGIANSRLNTEKTKVDMLTAQVTNLKASLSDVTAKYNDRVKIVKELQYSLDAARKEAGDARNEIGTLKAANSEIEARLNAALDALQAPSPAPADNSAETGEAAAVPAE